VVLSVLYSRPRSIVSVTDCFLSPCLDSLQQGCPTFLFVGPSGLFFTEVAGQINRVLPPRWPSAFYRPISPGGVNKCLRQANSPVCISSAAAWEKTRVNVVKNRPKLWAIFLNGLSARTSAQNSFCLAVTAVAEIVTKGCPRVFRGSLSALNLMCYNGRCPFNFSNISNASGINYKRVTGRIVPRAGRMLRYETRRYFNVQSKADTSQLNLPHGTDN